jgi:hypothetical protein
MTAQKMKPLLSRELLQSVGREIASFQLVWSELSGKEIGWEQAAAEWMRVGFPHWKRSQWKKAVAQAIEAVGDDNAGARGRAGGTNQVPAAGPVESESASGDDCDHESAALGACLRKIRHAAARVGEVRWMLVRNFDDAEPPADNGSGHTA